MLKGSQKMQVGSLKGTALRLCVLSSVICFFPFLKKTIELSNYIMISFRTGPPTENYCLHSQVISSTFQKVLRLIKILAGSQQGDLLHSTFFLQLINKNIICLQGIYYIKARLSMVEMMATTVDEREKGVAVLGS